MTTYSVIPEASTVWIQGSSSLHPVNASATGLTGQIDIALIKAGVGKNPLLSGDVRIAIDRLRSGNPLIDRETRRRVDAKNYPEIVGTVTMSQRVNTTTLDVSGEIQFRGETVPLDGQVTVERDGDNVVMTGSKTFDVRRWGLKLPRIGLLRVHPEVDVRIHLVAAPTNNEPSSRG